MNRLKTTAKWAGIILLAVLLLAAIVPFLIPVAPLDGLEAAQSVAMPDSQFVTIPFDGTDGIDIHYLADETWSDTEPTFVLLHGSVFNAFTWNETLDFFDERGRVIDPVILRSPSDILSQAAIDAVLASQFKPGLQRGRPVRVRYAVPVKFELVNGG